MTDYRHRLLEFLDQFQHYKGDILPVVEEYLKEIGRTERRLFWDDILKPMANSGYVKFPKDTIKGFYLQNSGQYFTDNLIVRMTYEGHDRLEEFRKKGTPYNQPPVMNITEETEHAMLNFFRLMGLQSEEDLYIDLKRSGVGFRPEHDFADLVKRDYFDEEYKGEIRKFKLNGNGLARFNYIESKRSSENEVPPYSEAG